MLPRDTMPPPRRPSVERDQFSVDSPAIPYCAAPSRIEVLSVSRQDNDLAAGLVFLHAAMRLDDLIQLEYLANLNRQLSRGDVLYKILERRQHEIFGTTIIGRQTHGRRNNIHGAEALERPAISHHAGHTHDAVLSRASQRVL